MALVNFRGPNANLALLNCFSDCLAIANRGINKKTGSEREKETERGRDKHTSEIHRAKNAVCLLASSTPFLQLESLFSGLCRKVPHRRGWAKTSTNHSASIRGGERQQGKEREKRGKRKKKSRAGEKGSESEDAGTSAADSFLVQPPRRQFCFCLRHKRTKRGLEMCTSR